MRVRIPWPWRRKVEQYRPAHAAGTAAAGGGLPELGTVDFRDPHKFAADPASTTGLWCACGVHKNHPLHGGGDGTR